MDLSLCAKRRITSRLEWVSALAITLSMFALDINYARHAGALWRDEANSLAMATYPSMAMTWDRLQFDSFPMLWHVVLRTWVGLGLGQTDAGFRVFGLIMNAGILAILWLNAWRMSCRPPLIAVTLLGANAAVMLYCGSVRAYGLGLVLGLWMYGTVWAYLIRPTPARWIAALLAAVLACHTLYYNCVFVATACLAGAGVEISHRRWRVAGMLLTLGSLTAMTMIIYIPTFRSVGEWRSIWANSGGSPSLWFRFVQAAAMSNPIMVSIWVATAVCMPLAALWTWCRTRNATVHGEDDGTQSPGQPDLALFGATTIVIGVVGNVLFLRLLGYDMLPWYFLCLMASVAAGADAVQTANSIGGGLRIAVPIAAVGLMLMLFSSLYTWSFVRLTNVDEIARFVARSATKDDYVVVTDWVHGVTFHRYYLGPAPWQTVPPLPADARDVHRADLVFKQMSQYNVIAPVLDSVAEALRNGHRVFYVGSLPKRFPSENPDAYYRSRLQQRTTPAPAEMWHYYLDYAVGKLATKVTWIPIELNQSVSNFENLQVAVFEGWRPAALEPIQK